MERGPSRVQEGVFEREREFKSKHGASPSTSEAGRGKRKVISVRKKKPYAVRGGERTAEKWVPCSSFGVGIRGLSVRAALSATHRGKKKA